jgi:hypothetical protein
MPLFRCKASKALAMDFISHGQRIREHTAPHSALNIVRRASKLPTGRAPGVPALQNLPFELDHRIRLHVRQRESRHCPARFKCQFLRIL